MNGILHHGNLKDYLKKVLSLLLHLAPTLSYSDTKTKLRLTGSCLKQSKISYAHGTIVNIYIVYELGASESNINDPTFKKLFIWCSYFK